MCGCSVVIFAGGSEEWDLVYNKRWSVESVFSRWKVEGCLTDHRLRQKKTIRLHSMFQMVALQAVILTRMKVGELHPLLNRISAVVILKCYNLDQMRALYEMSCPYNKAGFPTEFSSEVQCWRHNRETVC